MQPLINVGLLKIYIIKFAKKTNVRGEAMRSANEVTLCTLLKVMNDKGVTLSKIAIQKVAYFLITQGVTFGYRFKPFTYGPYSSELSQALDDLVFWDHLSATGNTYMIENLPDCNEDTLPQISECVDIFFDELVNTKTPTFDDVEIYGTILYCQESLKMVGDIVSQETILEEFKGWKGDKYPDSRIVSSYIHMKKVLQ